jgi:hypothetical protein
MRLARNEVELSKSNTGQVETLLWKKIVFSWDHSADNIDYYVTKEGCYVGVNPKYAYEKLTIAADFRKNTFVLKTGRGKLVTWINLLDL